MKVRPGREADFQEAWREVAEQAKQAPGQLRQALLRDPDDRSGFIVTSDWESREAFGRFETSPEQDVLTSRLRDLRESARMVIYELVAHVQKEVQE